MIDIVLFKVFIGFSFDVCTSESDCSEFMNEHFIY